MCFCSNVGCCCCCRCNGQWLATKAHSLRTKAPLVGEAAFVRTLALRMRPKLCGGGDDSGSHLDLLVHWPASSNARAERVHWLFCTHKNSHWICWMAAAAARQFFRPSFVRSFVLSFVLSFVRPSVGRSVGRPVRSFRSLFSCRGSGARSRAKAAAKGSEQAQPTHLRSGIERISTNSISA